MGNLDPSEKEMELLSKMQLEAAKMKGTEVEINLVDDFDLDINHDPEYKFLEGDSLDIILEERPSERFLKSLGWYSEEEDDLPLIAYISRDDWSGEKIKLLEGVKIILPFQISSEHGTRDYEIIKVKALPPNGIAYVANLVPIREKYEEEKEKDNEQNINYHILNKDE